MAPRTRAAGLIRGARAEGRNLLEHEALRLLEEYGFPLPRFEVLPFGKHLSPGDLSGLSYPLVVKAVSPQIVHKTEAGAVRLNIQGEEELLEAIRQSMGVYISHSELKGPASYRLAFRELGLALGLQALEPLQRLLSQNTSTFGDLDSIDALLNDLMRYKPIGGEIVRFWRTERAQAADTWTSHEDINAVMLAACLIPEGYLRV